MGDNYPQFPLYLPTKGRFESMYTSKYLTLMGVKHFLVVEPQEVEAYEGAVREFSLLATVLPMDMEYKNTYELCDDLGLTKSTGPGPARNFAWEHSIANGHDWHWVMDDNILSFHRFNENEKVKTTSPGIWRAMEDYVLRFKNVGMAGSQYFMFAFARVKTPPLILNTRIYSCNLIRNDLPFRWRGRYNEDTILSLDMLKKKWCTIQFNAFLQYKMETQSLKGGNSDAFYLVEGKKQSGEKYTDTGTLAKSQMLVKVHPDVSRVVHKFSRIHHKVDYRQFKKNRLVYRDDCVKPSSVNNYGMKLVQAERNG